MSRRGRETAAPRAFTPADLARYAGPLLLDTHIWLWLVEGDETRLTRRAWRLLDRCAAESHLVVSDISYWEVAVKSARGKLPLTTDAALWLQRAEEAPGIRFQPITRQILLRSTLLAGAAHNDPADRMLMATAQLLGIPLVTADRLIIAYAKAHAGLQVVDVRR